MAYRTVATFAPNVLEPYLRPDLARTQAGQFGVSQTIAKGTLLAQKTSDSKIYAYVQNDTQYTLAITGTLSAGGFRLGITDKNGVEKVTGLIAYNGANSDIQTAINVIIPQESATNQVVVGGTFATANTFTFSGDSYDNVPQPFVRFYPDGLTGMTGSSVTNTTTGEATGLEKACGIARRDIVVGSDGYIVEGGAGTVPDLLHTASLTEMYYITGDFLISSLVGYDAGVLVDMNATLMGVGDYQYIHIP